MTPDHGPVAFPGSEPVSRQIAQPRPPHLPFRRISLPTAPTLLHRHSVVSVASFDSHPEEEGLHGVLRSPGKRKTRLESPRRRDRSIKPDPSRLLKRRKIIDELYETEKTYVEGLDLVYTHFLVPIIKSLDTPNPILNRATLTMTFSNFIDIWNFHRSFFEALGKSKESIGPLLLSHFPYLSLYNPFITQFTSIVTSLSDLTTPAHQCTPELADREADPRCGRLKLRDWLLSIVQRCPRYLLLLKDLINNTEADDPEYAQLTKAHGLVSKITEALNTSIHAHTQTLALLALQKSTSGLPFQLISPGRTLLKRGVLLQAERNDPPRPRDFLLFSDCLIWLASTDMSGNSWEWDWSSMGGWNNSGSSQASAIPMARPPLNRSRSKSEAELPRLDSPSSSPTPPSMLRDGSSAGTPPSPLGKAHYQRRSHNFATPPPLPSAPPMVKRRSTTVSSEERWTFKGRADVVNLEVTVGSVMGEERRFEILSPEGSFVVYADSEQERDEWVSAIRQAKSHLLMTLNVTNPNSTLTSSASTNHVRKSLQALPFHPSDDRLAALNAEGGDHHKVLTPVSPKKAKAGKKDKGQVKVEVRRKVEHWVPPIWIPDGKTNECMRCSKLFGWRRRRHHCRLCGRCVCADCSGRTFFIADASGKAEGTKPARACDACYESVFPLVDDPVVDSQREAPPDHRPEEADTISSLSNLPSWVSMPSITSPKHSAPQALMAFDLTSPLSSSNEAERMAGKGLPQPHRGDERDMDDHDGQLRERRGGGVVRMRPHSKLRSYHDIVEDFQTQGNPRPKSDAVAYDNGEGLEETDVLHELEDADDYSHLFFTPPTSQGPSPITSPQRRKEDTARRSKRFSLPALALHTTSVTARASMMVEEDADVSREDDSSVASTPNRPKRFSVVLSPGKSGHGHAGSSAKEEDVVAKSLAMDTLSELLNRHSVQG
ncbi:hypothetical protein BKA70DRAFT_1330418 [Coprinopsis sp. MPI-PUGE-AT-0042]|nr:hypothetical protein BKA70DRAFT_1330418 [Coprinopsis sp. MPI-PUGE-AT-0042]